MRATTTDTALQHLHPCCAPEGALPTTTAGSGPTPAQRAAWADAQRDPWLWRLAVPAVLLGVCTGALSAADVLDGLSGWLA